MYSGTGNGTAQADDYRWVQKIRVYRVQSRWRDREICQCRQLRIVLSVWGSQKISNGKRKGRGNTKNGNRDPNLISKNLRGASAFQLLAGVAVVSNCWM